MVLHAGRQDVALLRRVWRTEVRGVFDTQVAAGFAGFGAQTGYGSLLNDVLGLRLAKSASFTRWDDRPLSPEQLAYARDDVAHLLRLADALQERLSASGRLQWAREECRRLEEATDERDPWLAWQRLPRVAQLNPRARAVARELAAWREQTAAAEDRPVSSVLGDAPLVEVAKRRPAAPSALERIRGLQPSTLRRRADAIVAAVARGTAAEALPTEVVERADSNPADVPAIALSEALVRARALDAGLAYELVAARNDLAQVVAAARRGQPEPPVRTLQGWRSRPGRRRAPGAAGRPPLPGHRRVRPPPDQPPLTRARAVHAVGVVAGEVAGELEGLAVQGEGEGVGGGGLLAGGDRALAGDVAVVLAFAALLVAALDGGVAEDELVVDRVGVAEHEPDPLARLDPDQRGLEAGVAHGHAPPSALRRPRPANRPTRRPPGRPSPPATRTRATATCQGRARIGASGSGRVTVVCLDAAAAAAGSRRRASPCLGGGRQARLLPDNRPSSGGGPC